MLPLLKELLFQALFLLRFHSLLLEAVMSREEVLLPRPTCLHMALGSLLISPQMLSETVLVVREESIRVPMLSPSW